MVNGRVGEDRPRDHMPCGTYNGQGVVDYVLCSPSHFDRIICFDVLNPNQCSYHSPCVYGMLIHIPCNPRVFPQIYLKMRWDDKNIDAYKSVLVNDAVTTSLDEVHLILSDETSEDVTQISSN